MVVIIDCAACRFGDHAHHVEDFAPAPEGAMGGARCACRGECVDRPAFSAREVQAAVEAVIVHERDRTARLLAGHASIVSSNAATIQAAARKDKRTVGRYLTTAELHAAAMSRKERRDAEITG